MTIKRLLHVTWLSRLKVRPTCLRHDHLYTVRPTHIARTVTSHANALRLPLTSTISPHKRSRIAYYLALPNSLGLSHHRYCSFPLPLLAAGAILSAHRSRYLIRSFFYLHTAHHYMLVLEYLAGGDLGLMLANVGFIEEEAARFYTSEVLLGPN